MSKTYRRQQFLLGLVIFIVFTLACTTLPISLREADPTATAIKPDVSTPSPTPTTTGTLSFAQATLTEYASQAGGTRQALAITEAVLMQDIDATATARSLDATATVLAPLPSVNEQVEVQANVMWQETGIQVRRGNIVDIQYIEGEWTIWIDTDPLTDGMGQYGRDETCRLMPDANLGGLIGRVGENSPFFIGNGTEYYSDHNGALQLSINDCPPFGGNAGTLTVSIVIER